MAQTGGPSGPVFPAVKEGQYVCSLIITHLSYYILHNIIYRCMKFICG